MSNTHTERLMRMLDTDALKDALRENGLRFDAEAAFSKREVRVRLTNFGHAYRWKFLRYVSGLPLERVKPQFRDVWTRTLQLLQAERAQERKAIEARRAERKQRLEAMQTATQDQLHAMLQRKREQLGKQRVPCVSMRNKDSAVRALMSLEVGL